ncbi:MAG: molybdate ABC transporter substrate-binding protein [Anaerobutyricum soehngenii]|uniref:Molybdate ABC transporter substrate-binding protein n=1 Tax=Anaerobutyricum soehngenii TaxID=105843 RepID=A0A6N7XYN5_9FIRM|nr:molybdate ABC transporter substrate-binding protein [Anaerobutyricum soehngenii]MDY5245110.1 molybdate ABC transporter substrate-binding protein [Anaerobutyricum soehngenii]MSU81939.1 molybdate ABC transporter substrate-binding protein [Anaerobutyricum soehngenii]
MRNMKFVKRIGAVALAVCMVLSCAGCGGASNKGASEGTTEVTTEGGKSKILVAAAASLQATFDNELIPLFEKENPEITVEGTYASSGDLQQQIESGLDADVFFSAATSNMDTLTEEKLIDKDTVVDLLKNDVVLITPKDSKLGIKSFKDITKADTIAIGDPESVPAGKYAKEILTNLGVYNEVEKKASLGASVTEVLSWVAEGSADAGIVYATDAQTENTNGDDKEVEVVATAEDSMMQTPVVYPVGVVSASAHKDEAKAFEDFLQTDEAKAILEKAGFTINK